MLYNLPISNECAATPPKRITQNVDQFPSIILRALTNTKFVNAKDGPQQKCSLKMFHSRSALEGYYTPEVF